MADIQNLEQQFGIPGILSFIEGDGGLPLAHVANPLAEADIALQGAHLLTWTPKGEPPVVWLSPQAKFAPGKSVRGGVPVCWPWFGVHPTGWRHGCPGGESLEDVAGRARGVVQRLLHEHGQEAERQHGTAAAGGAGGAGQMPQERRSPDVAVFSHGHFLRALVAVWLELPASRGRSFGLHADSVSILGFEHGNPVVWSWDWTEHLLSGGH